MQKRLYLCSIIILVLGLCSAVLIYLTVGEGPNVDDGYKIVVIDGKTYPTPLSDTKIYRHQLERFGGKAAVLFDDFNRWFAGLWQGKSLAVTVAWITVFLSFGVFLLARELPSDSEFGVAGDGNQDEPR